MSKPILQYEMINSFNGGKPLNINRPLNDIAFTVGINNGKSELLFQELADVYERYGDSLAGIKVNLNLFLESWQEQHVTNHVHQQREEPLEIYIKKSKFERNYNITPIRLLYPSSLTINADIEINSDDCNFVIDLKKVHSQHQTNSLMIISLLGVYFYQEVNN